MTSPEQKRPDQPPNGPLAGLRALEVGPVLTLTEARG